MADAGDAFKEKIKDLKEYVVLATVKAEKYQNTNMEIIRHLTEKENVPGVYVTLSKPYETVEKQFKKAGIDTELILFIDAVSTTGDSGLKKTEKCLFIGSPQKLSDISIAMDQAVHSLPSQQKFVFFDSLSVLLLYNEVETVAKFIHFLATKMRSWKVKGIIISLEKEKDKDLIDELSQFCDVKM